MLYSVQVIVVKPFCRNAGFFFSNKVWCCISKGVNSIKGMHSCVKLTVCHECDFLMYHLFCKTPQKLYSTTYIRFYGVCQNLCFMILQRDSLMDLEYATSKESSVLLWNWYWWCFWSFCFFFLQYSQMLKFSTCLTCQKFLCIAFWKGIYEVIYSDKLSPPIY